MKIQYLCSALQEIRDNTIEYFIASDYATYLEILKSISPDKLSYCPSTFSSPTERLSAAQHTENIFELLLTYFTQCLKRIHNYGSDLFWERALGLPLHSIITKLYAKFILFQNTFDPKKFHFKIISYDQPAFYMFENVYDFTMTSEKGAEYIFAKYIQTIYPEIYHTNVINFCDFKKKPHKEDNFLYKPPITYFKRYSLINLVRKVFYVRSPVVGLMGTSISTRNSHLLTIASLGKIQCIYPQMIKQDVNKNIDLRNLLFEDFPLNDCFLRFLKNYFFETFPTIYLESFSAVKNQITNFWKKFPKLKFIINEVFIGHSIDNLYLSFAKEEYKIFHYHNEHGGMNHQYLMSNTPKYIKFSDKMLTIGWDSPSPKTIPLGTLRNWGEYKGSEKWDVTFFACPHLRNISSFGGVDSFSGSYNIERTFAFYRLFFSSLPKKILRRILYRPYKSFLDLYAPLPNDLKMYISEMLTDNSNIAGIDLLAQSKLAIYTYINSGYLEALYNNKPCIIYYDPDRQPLQKKYINFFNDLIQAGIIVKTANDAASLLINIIDDPQSWWRSKQVQQGREAFFEKNIGSRKALFNFLVNLSKDKKINQNKS